MEEQYGPRNQKHKKLLDIVVSEQYFSTKKILDVQYSDKGSLRTARGGL